MCNSKPGRRSQDYVLLGGRTDLNSNLSYYDYYISEGTFKEAYRPFQRDDNLTLSYADDFIGSINNDDTLNKLDAAACRTIKTAPYFQVMGAIEYQDWDCKTIVLRVGNSHFCVEVYYDEWEQYFELLDDSSDGDEDNDDESPNESNHHEAAEAVRTRKETVMKEESIITGLFNGTVARIKDGAKIGGAGEAALLCVETAEEMLGRSLPLPDFLADNPALAELAREFIGVSVVKFIAGFVGGNKGEQAIHIAEMAETDIGVRAVHMFGPAIRIKVHEFVSRADSLLPADDSPRPVKKSAKKQPLTSPTAEQG